MLAIKKMHWVHMSTIKNHVKSQKRRFAHAKSKIDFKIKSKITVWGLGVELASLACQQYDPSTVQNTKAADPKLQFWGIYQ